MSDESFRVPVFVLIGNIQREAGQTREAALNIRRALDEARSIQYQQPRDFALVEVFPALARDELFVEALAAAAEISDAYWRVKAFIEIGLIQLIKDRKPECLVTLKKALSAAQTYSNDGLRVTLMVEIAVAFARMGETARALEVIDSFIVDPGTRVAALASVAGVTPE